MQAIFQEIAQWYLDHINYLTIIGLMAIESSFLPFPSEIIIPPAAYMAAQGKLNIYLVILCGSAGAVIGATFNYLLALSLGRILIYKLADTRLAEMLMINKHSVENAEAYFIRHGKSSTFIGRLVPAVRHLISLPAGLAKMKYFDFILYTFLGATVWNIVLAILGYFLYSQKELLHKYFIEISYAFLFLGIVFVIYLIYRVIRKK